MFFAWTPAFGTPSDRLVLPAEAAQKLQWVRETSVLMKILCFISGAFHQPPSNWWFGLVVWWRMRGFPFALCKKHGCNPPNLQSKPPIRKQVSGPIPKKDSDSWDTAPFPELHGMKSGLVKVCGFPKRGRYQGVSS